MGYAAFICITGCLSVCSFIIFCQMNVFIKKTDTLNIAREKLKTEVKILQCCGLDANSCFGKTLKANKTKLRRYF